MLSVLGGEGVSGPPGGGGGRCAVHMLTQKPARPAKTQHAECPHTHRVCSGSLQPLHRTVYVHYLEQVVIVSTSGALTHVHSYIQHC